MFKLPIIMIMSSSVIFLIQHANASQVVPPKPHTVKKTKTVTKRIVVEPLQQKAAKPIVMEPSVKGHAYIFGSGHSKAKMALEAKCRTLNLADGKEVFPNLVYVPNTASKKP